LSPYYKPLLNLYKVRFTTISKLSKPKINNNFRDTAVLELIIKTKGDFSKVQDLKRDLAQYILQSSDVQNLITQDRQFAYVYKQMNTSQDTLFTSMKYVISKIVDIKTSSKQDNNLLNFNNSIDNNTDLSNDDNFTNHHQFKEDLQLINTKSTTFSFNNENSLTNVIENDEKKEYLSYKRALNKCRENYFRDNDISSIHDCDVENEHFDDSLQKAFTYSVVSDYLGTNKLKGFITPSFVRRKRKANSEESKYDFNVNYKDLPNINNEPLMNLPHNLYNESLFDEGKSYRGESEDDFMRNLFYKEEVGQDYN
jgi:hypothetical protein